MLIFPHPELFASPLLIFHLINPLCSNLLISLILSSSHLIHFIISLLIFSSHSFYHLSVHLLISFILSFLSSSLHSSPHILHFYHLMHHLLISFILIHFIFSLVISSSYPFYHVIRGLLGGFSVLGLQVVIVG